jgi:Flp pilus assembly protein TadG
MPPNRLYSMMGNRNLPAPVEAAPAEKCPPAAGDPPPPARGREKGRAYERKRHQRGSEMLEYTLVLLPFLGFTFLIMDVAWVLYTQATIQNAVAEGVRYCITSQTMSGYGLFGSTRNTVQTYAMGNLGATTTDPGYADIVVSLYSPGGTLLASSTQSSPPAGASGPATDGTLPLVQVSVQGLVKSPLVPVIKMPGLGTLGAMNLAACAWDRMESPPLGGVPALTP